MAMNRQAVFFSLTALLIIGALFVVLNTPEPREDAAAIELRVRAIKADFDHLTQNNLPIILRDHTIKELNAIAKVAAPPGGPYRYTNINALNNGLIGCFKVPSQCSVPGGPQSQTFTQDIQAINTIYSTRMQYIVTANLETISLTQVGPWEILATSSMVVTFTDSAGIAQFNKTVPVSVIVPVEGLVDPLPSREMGVKRKVKRWQFFTPTGVPVDWTVAKVIQHATEGSYIEDPLAPSYLNRLMGDLTADPFGISSLVAPGTYPPPRPYTDYLVQPLYDPNVNCIVTVDSTPGQELYLLDYYAFVYNMTGLGLPISVGCTTP